MQPGPTDYSSVLFEIGILQLKAYFLILHPLARIKFSYARYQNFLPNFSSLIPRRKVDSLADFKDLVLFSYTLPLFEFD